MTPILLDFARKSGFTLCKEEPALREMLEQFAKFIIEHEASQKSAAEPVACQYGNGGYACCEGGPCKADEQNKAAEQRQWVWLKDDELIAAYRRGRDSVPTPTNGWCFVDDHIPGLREVQREVLYTLREKNGGGV